MEESKVGDYRLEGSRLILTRGPDTTWDCRNGAFVPDVGEALTDTSTFLVKGDSLLLESQPFDLLSPGIFMKSVTPLTRVGSGEGLNGAWRAAPAHYVHVTGPITDSILRDFAFRTEYQAHLASFETRDLIFTASELRYRSRFRPADSFLDWWNGGFRNLFPADSSKYVVAIAKAAQDSVILTGLRTGEVVSISFREKTIRTYSSSNPLRPPYVEPSDSGCSMNPEITWYETFLKENLKPGVLPKPG